MEKLQALMKMIIDIRVAEIAKNLLTCRASPCLPRLLLTELVSLNYKHMDEQQLMSPSSA